MHNHLYDVVIIGGGCAGSATALSLLKKGIKKIAIIEKNNFSQSRVGETIQPPTVELLKQLDAWDDFVNDGHLPSSGVASAWGTNELIYTDFIYRARGKGWHLDRNKFDKTLLSIAQKKGVKVFSNTRFKKALKTQNYWKLSCDQSEVTAKFVVDATGRSHSFAKQQGSKKIYFDDLHGIYTYWKQPEGVQKKFGTTHTLVETTENGWWYSALLPNGTLAVAFMTDTAIIKKEQIRKIDHYVNLLKKSFHTRKRVESFSLESETSVKVAASYELNKVVGDQWMAVGDSASAYDPLSSYGIHKGIHNAIEASHFIEESLKSQSTDLSAYGSYIKNEFETYLATRYKYYQMEQRWEKHPFWSSRQNPITVHPMKKLSIQDTARKHHKTLNRILPQEDLKELIDQCSSPQNAMSLVQFFQEKTHKKYPDWRVIQAVSFLHDAEIIG